MDEVLNALDGMLYGPGTGVAREENNGVLILSCAFASMGMILANEAFFHGDFSISGVMEGVILGLCILKMVCKVKEKPVAAINMLLFLLFGIGWIQNGFSWQKGVMAAILLFFDICPGVVTTGIVVSAVSSFIASQGTGGLLEPPAEEYRWAAVLFLSLAVWLLIGYAAASFRDGSISKLYLKRDALWVVALICYLHPVLYGNRFFGRLPWELLTMQEFRKLGICGMGFCLAWIARKQLVRMLRK
jgi:hypothetical protein